MVLNKDFAQCECLFIMKDGDSKWYRIRFSYIGASSKTNIISGTFFDVTMERKLEKELSGVFGMLNRERDKRDNLLIIDDSEINRDILGGIFEGDYRVLEAKDGNEGLEILEKHYDDIAAVLLDMVMPHMDGSEFLFYKNQMACAADIPVIVISPDDTEKSKLKMLENGVNDYVTKPFVYALVKQRVRNVIEYNSRFRTLVQEYKQVQDINSIEKVEIFENGYAVDFIRTSIQFMSEIFELVRLVDPTNTTVINILPDNSLERVPYSCFQIWGRETRCENCSSLCSLQGKCVLSKYELLKNDVFYVVSRPVKMYLTEDVAEDLVLEIASRVSNEQAIKLMNEENFLDIIENTQRMIYQDPLTEAFNRRYLDEMLFLTHGQNEIAHKVGFIMIDLNKFKQINDLFGHSVGDYVLTETVASLKSQIRGYDSVIRYGGDEFIIAMTNCEEDAVIKAMHRMKQGINNIGYGPNNAIHVEADMGYSYTDDFHASSDMLDKFIKKADMSMYSAKHARATNISR